MTANVRKLILPAGRLPTCPQERRACLDAYFDDLLASVRATSDGWEIDLNWPTTPDYYVDPNLEQGLAWWCEGTQVDEIYMQVSHTDRGQLSLRDAWTLYSWSNWLAERLSRGLATKEVVILHVDDHNDLMTPRLIRNGDIWDDAITNELFDVFLPQSVRSAILHGAVGIGSFISPLIHSVPQVHLRHLSQSCSERQQDSLLLRQTLADELLRIDGLRPSVQVAAQPDVVINGHSQTAGTYRLTRQLDRWLADLPNVPVLLHVDMDYFNNRFDGDSEWLTRRARHDPSQGEIIEAIDGLFKKIGDSEVASRIENVTVALSPGFFPAELWAPSIARMQRHLAVLGWTIGTPKR